jgi:hypothetical protein
MSKQTNLLLNVRQLKEMAIEAERAVAFMKKNPMPFNPASPSWLEAYQDIARGTARLWRLLDEVDQSFRNIGPEDVQ